MFRTVLPVFSYAESTVFLTPPMEIPILLFSSINLQEHLIHLLVVFVVLFSCLGLAAMLSSSCVF